jgi:hypothetical protein
MMKTLLLSLFIVFLPDLAKADTIDYYHVYYNNVNIRRYNLHDINDSSTVIIFERDSLLESDILCVKYRNDTGFDPSSHLSVSSKKGDQLGEFYSRNGNFDVPLKTLLLSLRAGDQGLFEIHYTVDIGEGKSIRYVLFFVQIE